MPAVVMLLVALVIAAGTAWFISQGDAPGGGGGAGSGGGSSASEIEIVGVGDFDPQGDNEEHSDQIDFAIDEDRNASGWSTETYRADTLTGKQGVGIYVGAGESVAATSMDIRTPTPGWTLEIYGSNDPIPAEISGWTRLAQVDEVTENEQVDLITAGASYQYYLLWITDAVEIDGGFGATITDVRLFE